MNTSQIIGILRIVVPSAFTFAIAKGWLTQDTATQLGIFLASIAAAGGYSAVSNSTVNLAKTVAAIPDVQVHVGIEAPPELQEAAHDRSVKDIVPATGTPIPASPYATQRKI